VGIVDDDDPPPPSAERKGVGAYEESVDPVVPTPLPSSVSSSLVATVPLVVGKSVVPAGVPPIVGDGVVIAVVPVEDVVVVETAVETAVPDAVGTSVAAAKVGDNDDGVGNEEVPAALEA